VQVVILAGGLGTRLGGLTRETPKPLISVAGRPFLERQVEFLAAQGFHQFLLLSGFLGERIEAHFGDGRRFGVQVEHSREPQPLGTGGGVRRALARLEDRFLLLYGDSFLPIAYARLAERLDSTGLGGVMAVHAAADGATGVAPNVALDEDGRVNRYAKGVQDGGLAYIEAGALALRAVEIARLPDGVSSLEKDLYPEMIASGRMAAWVTPTPFYDIGTPDGLSRAEAYFAAAESGRET
jgi:D-glycero-D-manno-heptose 1,7-bisphosphate phosphatase